MHVEFGLANPAVFAMLIDPGRASSAATLAELEVLRARVLRVAATGRLRVSEAEAVALIQAAGAGVILALISTLAADRDPHLSATMHDAVMRTILEETPAPAGDPVLPAAVTLQAALPDLRMLTDAERVLLGEWLDKIAAR